MVQTTTNTVSLTPNYRLASSVILFGLVPLLTRPWIGNLAFLFGIPVVLIGLFLLYQTPNIQLIFTPTALEVTQGEKPLRTFPYAEWESWKIFWQPVPVLFYFKEVNSIHFVPILYNPTELRNQLEKHCPNCAV